MKWVYGILGYKAMGRGSGIEGMKQRGNTIRKTPHKFQSKKTSDGDARRTHVCDASGYRV